MREETVDASHLADEVIVAVREIVKQDSGKRAKLSALRKLGASLGEAAIRCQKSYEKAKATGNAAAMATLKHQHELIDRSMHQVSATAKKLVQRKPKTLGFDCEPNYFLEPNWDR